MVPGEVMSSQPTPVEQAVWNLRLSPMFNLSLSSKELFHSNFLAWLCQTYQEEAGRLFAQFLKTRPESFAPLEVRREKNRIDLSLKYPGGERLLIENKVKSIPSRSQLVEYSARADDLAKTSFLLLSLVRPPFLPPDKRIIRLDDGVTWRYLAYGELGANLQHMLRDFSSPEAYHCSLLFDYSEFVMRLHVLQHLLAIDWEDEEGDFFIDKEDMQLLRDVRIHDLFDKLRCAQLVQRLECILGDQGFKVSYGNLSQQSVVEGTPAGHVLLDAGMTRGTGIADLKVLPLRRQAVRHSRDTGHPGAGGRLPACCRSVRQDHGQEGRRLALATAPRKKDMVRSRACPQRIEGTSEGQHVQSVRQAILLSFQAAGSYFATTSGRDHRLLRPLDTRQRGDPAPAGGRGFVNGAGPPRSYATMSSDLA